jgi:hypothetical protein
VTVFLGFNDPHQIPFIKHEIESYCKERIERNIESVTLLFVAKKEFQRVSHGRYIRFDERILIIDLGMELFYQQQDGLWRQCQYTPSHALATVKEFRKIEAGLRPADPRCHHVVRPLEKAK